jgi:formylglycine-generating enzyme required for sulfatase activity
MLRIVLAAVVALAGVALKAEPSITGLEVTQDASTKVVTMKFNLSEKAIVTMDLLTNGVSIGADNYRGVRDVYSKDNSFPANRVVAAGDKTWVWQPKSEWPGYAFDKGEFSVDIKAWSFDSPPDYMVIDANVRSNAFFYAKAEDLPDGGLKRANQDDAEQLAELEKDVYRTTKIVLRKIPAAGVKWRMGSPEDEKYRRSDETPHYVTLTNDYYVAVYLFSFTQARNFFGTQDSVTVNIGAKHNMSYTGARGKIANYCWPENGHDVSPSSGFGYLRERTGFRFDFLTEAEWEYACRAGSGGKWCDGSESPSEVAWAKLSGGSRSYVPGGKNPNAWGIYDMHGLVNEWVLDQYGAYGEEAVVSPVGVTTNPDLRVLRGGPRNHQYNGSWTANVSVRSAYRGSYDPTKTVDGGSNGFGVRISCPASLPEWFRQKD